MISRREWLKGATAVMAIAQGGWGALEPAAMELPHGRPAKADRHFTSEAVEALIPRIQRSMGDAALATIFENCFPNTLDTTVFPGSYAGKPDTYIVTGDIDAMWLRDSSAQVWPYLPLAKQDAQLRELLEGVIRRQARMILLDPYANAFMRDEKATPLSWAVNDKTEHHPGVGERKWEVDSLCYTIRLAHGYWRATGDTRPFDSGLECCGIEDTTYRRTRQFVLSEGNPYFCRGKAGEGVGSPHEGLNMIWPMSIVYRALTTTDEREIQQCLRSLRNTT